MKPVLHIFPTSLKLVTTLSLAASFGTLAVTAATAQANPTTVRSAMSGPRAVRRSAAAVSVYSSTVLASSPFAYYTLNDTSTTMSDSGPNGVDGAYGPGVRHGSPALTSTGDPAPYFAGGSYDLTNVATVPASTSLQPPSAVSMEGWVSAAAFNPYLTYIPIVSYGRQAQGPVYIARLTAQNAINVTVKTTSGSVQVLTKTVMQPGQPHQFVATYNGSTLSVYVDGKFENSKPQSGALDYSGVHPYDGLGIGDSLDNGFPVFNGSISEISLYGRALTASEVLSHYVAGVKVTLLNEVPATTESFIDIEGVNTHFHYTNSVYATSFSAVQSLLVGLGVHHLRDGLVDTTWQPYYDHLNALGQAGIKATLYADRDLTTSAVIVDYPNRVPNSIEAYEAPNEQDLNFASDPAWASKAVAFQKLLFNTVHGNTATNKYPVLAPSLTSMQAYQAVGDLTAYSDKANEHAYFSAFNPGTSGFGGYYSYGIYGSLDFYLNVSKVTANKPLNVTETGYNTGAGAQNTPQDIQEKYLPRTFAEMFNKGIRRALLYQFLDDTQGYGLVTNGLAPKPAYYALMNMNALLADPGPAFTPTTFSYLLAGNVSNVHHLLMQKRDGSYYLMLWIEAPSFVPNSGSGGGGTYVTVASQDVSLQLQAAPRSVALTAWNTAGSTSTTAIAPASTLSIPVTDNISVVHIVP